MCGIAGLFGTRGGDARAMIAAIAHRGPDDTGFWRDDRTQLAHARLAIVDLSPAGHQPMANAAGDIRVVYNGEIYNWRSERAALEAAGHRFHSDSDTEVLLALYERHGEACVARLRGIFAFAIHDRRGGPGREKLLLARDQFGIKPMLYHRTAEGGIAFASELKAMLASGLVAPGLDPEALRTLLSFGSVVQPRTMLADVQALPAAHYLLAGPDGVQLRRYWSWPRNAMPELRRLPYEELVRRGAAVLGESIALQRMADVPVGAFLSGGVDSSLIVALMAAGQTARLKTFSVGFEGEAGAVDETAEAAVVARHLGTDHTRVSVGARDALASLDHFAAALDQPSVDGFNSYFVSRATAQGVKVALSGTGGDELFAGYPWFAGMVPPPRGPSWLPRWLRREPPPAPDFLDRYSQFYRCCGPEGPPTLLAADWRETAGRFVPMAEDLAPLDELADAPVLDRVSALCLNGYTRNQLLRDIDACSMAHALEVRVPFLDPVVAAFALSLPQDARLRPGGDWLDGQASYDRAGIKRIVVDIARPHLPASFFAERPKRGFGLPLNDWLRGPLRDVLRDTLSPEALRRRGLFDAEAVTAMLDRYQAGEGWWNVPWLLLITELWCRQVLDRAVQPAAASAR